MLKMFATSVLVILTRHPLHNLIQVIQEIVQNTSPGVHAYMPNGGYPWVREAIAARMSSRAENDHRPG